MGTINNYTAMHVVLGHSISNKYLYSNNNNNNNIHRHLSCTMTQHSNGMNSYKPTSYENYKLLQI